ncbi:MAG: helix-turn-helix transcriptional regulator [Clostridia bacterium]|nr:helix-turn-helix transcriptional regulator [Clostridia bacterium]
MIIAQRIRQLRIERGVSRSAVGRALGVDGFTVMFWEQELSQPDASDIYSLCFYFTVSADYLLGISDHRD